MDFVDKKEKLADLIESYLADDSKKDEVLNYVEELSKDSDFKDKELFMNLFGELLNYFNELSKKELKQRILMIRTYLE